jgi:hypothetical protein
VGVFRCNFPRDERENEGYTTTEDGHDYEEVEYDQNSDDDDNNEEDEEDEEEFDIIPFDNYEAQKIWPI